MSSRSNNTSRSNSVGHTNVRPTANVQPSRSSPGSASPTIDAQTLLTPVVRSKRTPIACTECRRRQVKCTGASPQCERCEKKGVKCQYIPCSQQKANAASSSSQASQSPVSPPSYPVGHSQYHSPQWQQPDSNVQGYIPDSSGGYATPMDWRKSTHRTLSHHQHFGQQPISISPYGADYPTTTYSPQGSFHQQPPMTRGGGSATQTQYSQSGYQSQGGYSQTDPVVSSLPYYGVAQSRLPTQMVAPNTSNYTGDYYPSGEVFSASGMVSEAGDKGWDVYNPTLQSYHGAQYS